MKSIILGILVCTLSFALGGCASSLNTKEDRQYAVECRKAAAQGDADAQYELGLCYGVGCGVPEDEVEAAKWYRKAAEQGHAEAQSDLGFCYLIGSGVPEDAVMAAKWGRKAVKGYRKAAKQGNTAALIGLGSCYALGVGVPEDMVEAYAFYNLSDSHKSTDRMAKKMTPEQIAAAKIRAKELEKDFKK